MPMTDQAMMNSYTGNGVTTSFAYGFKIFASSDLKVTLDGVTKVLNTDYAVTGVGNDGGGNVVFGTAPVNLTAVTIASEVPYARTTTDYQDNGDLLAATLDNDLDKVVRLAQQLRRDVKRAIKLPIEETDDKGIASTPSARVNKVLAFDATGAPVAKTATQLLDTMVSIGAGLQLVDGDLSLTDPALKGVAGGTVDTITANIVPAPAALTNNLRVCIEALGANATATPSFTLNALASKTIVKFGNLPLVPGDIPGANSRIDLVFDASLDKWVLLNPANPAVVYAVDTGAADAYIANIAPGKASTEGIGVILKVTNANATGTPTLDAGDGAKTIVRENSAALSPGDMPQDHIAILYRKGTTWLLLNPCKVAGHDHSDGTKGGKLGASAISAVLGAWDAAKSVNTVYQASTDLDVYLRSTSGGEIPDLQGLTNSSNPPTTVRARYLGNDGAEQAYIAFRVKKNDYWKVTSSKSGNTVYALPIGS